MCGCVVLCDVLIDGFVLYCCVLLCFIIGDEMLCYVLCCFVLIGYVMMCVVLDCFDWCIVMLLVFISGSGKIWGPPGSPYLTVPCFIGSSAWTGQYGMV